VWVLFCCFLDADAQFGLFLGIGIGGLGGGGGARGLSRGEVEEGVRGVLLMRMVDFDDWLLTRGHERSCATQLKPQYESTAAMASQREELKWYPCDRCQRGQGRGKRRGENERSCGYRWCSASNCAIDALAFAMAVNDAIEPPTCCIAELKATHVKDCDNKHSKVSNRND
jgi:hypothetical protein